MHNNKQEIRHKLPKKVWFRLTCGSFESHQLENQDYRRPEKNYESDPIHSNDCWILEKRLIVYGWWIVCCVGHVACTNFEDSLKKKTGQTAQVKVTIIKKLRWLLRVGALWPACLTLSTNNAWAARIVSLMSESVTRRPYLNLIPTFKSTFTL